MEEKSLTEICNPKQWKTISQNEMLKEGYLVYGANGVIGHYKEYNHKNPTVLITCRGATCGTLNISEPFSYINGNAMCLDDVDKKLNEKFLYYFLKQRGFKDIISGSAQPQITIQNLSKVKVQVPSLSEQERIVAILDKANEIKKKKQQANKKLDEFLKSTFLDLFGDPVSNSKFKKEKLADKLLYVQNGISRRRKISQNIGELVLRIKEIRENYIDYSNINRIPLEEKEKEKYKVNENELLFIRVNGNKEYVGRNTVFKKHFEDVFFNDHIMRVNVDKNKIDPIYLSRFLNLSFGKDEIKKYIKTSAGQFTINQQGLGSVEIPLPPLPLQTKFAEIVEKVEAQKAKNEKELEHIDNFINSLMQKAFKGEL